MPKQTAVPSPFVAWLAQVGTAKAAERCDVSEQTIRNWRNGARVNPTRHATVKLEAAKDGVVLTTDDLLGAA